MSEDQHQRSSNEDDNIPVGEREYGEKEYHYDSQSIIDFLRDEEKKCERNIDFNWLTSATLQRSFKLLLVFQSHEDYQCEILDKVARKLGWSVEQARNAVETIDIFHQRQHDVVIIDRRSHTRIEVADNICKYLNNDNVPKICTILALVKRTYFTAPHQEDTAIFQLINLGYSRALMECSHEGILMNELIGIHYQEWPHKSQLAAAQLMYSAFEKNKLMIILTSSSWHILFVNRAAERLSFKRAEMLGHNISEFIANADMNNIFLKISKKNEFKGEILWKKKMGDPIKLNLIVATLTLPANNCHYNAFFLDSTIKTEILKADILAKKRTSFFQDLPLEAPLTKIITLLTTAMSHTDDFTINSQIESALQLLKFVELHSPQIKEETKDVDPVIEDIIETVFNDNESFVKRQSSIASSFPSVLHFMELPDPKSSTRIVKDVIGPPELEELLENVFDWNFDIFKLEAITERRPLYYVGVVLMSHFRVAERLQCDERTLRNWLTVMEANYNSHVEYHNSTHATDVMQALARFMRSERLKILLEPLDEVAALIAAACHDLGHPGKSSQFLCNGSDKLAILYNDLTVLESHHSALTFKVTLAHESVNIFKNLNRELYRFMRTNIIDMILATEMTKHFEHLAKFVNVCNTNMENFGDVPEQIYTDDVINTNVFLIPENLTMTKRMIIKCADVSNPTRSMRDYVEWTRRIAMEYFDQTDEEKKKRWPIMMPMFDRGTCSIPKSQLGFVDYIIHDMMEAWDAFIDMPELVGNMNRNYKKWKEYDEQGIISIEEIEELQKLIPELNVYRIPRKITKK